MEWDATWLRLAARRLVLPVLLSAVAIDFGAFLIWFAAYRGPAPPTLHDALQVVPIVFIVTCFCVGVAVTIFGLPAGLLVARLRHGFEASLLLLAGLGCFAGAAAAILTMLGLTGTLVEPWLVLASAASGALTGTIWAFLNSDLFRTNNGA
ncbi:MAG TPA: hypothetical protein VF693_09160 [Allosphingosinicella sp.]|jgi:hypothetical protein